MKVHEGDVYVNANELRRYLRQQKDALQGGIRLIENIQLQCDLKLKEQNGESSKAEKKELNKQAVLEIIEAPRTEDLMEELKKQRAEDEYCRRLGAKKAFYRPLIDFISLIWSKIISFLKTSFSEVKNFSLQRRWSRI